MKHSKQNLLATVIGNELHRKLFDPLVLGAAFAIVVCVVLATVYSADAYQWNVKQFLDLSAPREESPTANLSAVALAEPSAVQILARGTGDIMARPVSAMRQLEAAFNIKYNVGQSRRQKELIHSLLDSVDPLYVLKLLLPILAMLLSYGAICGDRQSGVLRQALSNPVRRRTLLTAKLIAGMVILLMVSIIISLSVVTTFWIKNIHIPGEELWRITAIFFAMYLYSTVFLIIGLLVSTTVQSPDLSILANLAIWCLLVIVAPGMASGLAEVLSDTPPAHLIYAEKLAQERAVRGGDANEGPAEGMKEINARALDRIGDIDSNFFASISRQQSLARNIGAISPAVDLESIVTSFAGTSIAEEHELMRQLRRHFRLISGYDDIEQTLFSRSIPDELPDFTYTPLTPGSIMEATIVPWGALVVLGLFLLFFAYLQINRYDVR